IAATLAYLDKLRGEGIARHYFDEQKALAERSFVQNAPPPPMQQAIHATAFMQHFPVQVVNSLGARFDQFDPEAITAVVDQLRPERMRLWHIGNSEPVDSDIPYYDGRYAVQDISVAELKDWQTEASTIELALPGANTLASTGKQS